MAFNCFAIEKLYVMDFEDVLSSVNLDRNEYNTDFKTSIFFDDLAPQIVDSNIVVVSSINKNVFDLEKLRLHHPFKNITFCQPKYYYPNIFKRFETLFRTFFFLNHVTKYECLEKIYQENKDKHLIFIYSTYYFSNDLFKKFLKENVIFSYEEHVRYISMDTGFSKRDDVKKLFISNNKLYKKLGIEHKSGYEENQFYLNFTINTNNEVNIYSKPKFNQKQMFELFRYRIDK